MAIPRRDNSLGNIGRPNSWTPVGTGWAAATEAPYYLLKTNTGEGGIHVPAFVSGAALGIPMGRREDSLIMTYDVAPTILELAGVSTAPPKDQPEALPITGRSFASVLRGQANATRRGANDVVGWEHSGQAAIRRGDWKLLWVGAGGPGPGGASRPVPREEQGLEPVPGAGPEAGGCRARAPRSRAAISAGQPAGDPVGAGGDPGSFTTCAKIRVSCTISPGNTPEIVAQLVKDWQRYVAENGVIVKSGQPATP